MAKIRTCTPDNKGIVEIVKYAKDILKEYGVDDKKLHRTVLEIEESAASIIEHTAVDESVSVRARKFPGMLRFELSAKGEKYRLTEHMGDTVPDDDTSDAVQDMIRGILLKSLSEDITYRYIHGANHIYISCRRNKRSFLYLTLGAMLLAVIAGILLSAVGAQGFNSVLDSYFLIPVKTMYMNALKMVVAPVVFFSIVSCIVRFTDISELGRIGARILLMYFLTTLIAVAVGMCSFWLFKPGSALSSATAVQSADDITSKTFDVSIKDMIVGIVPSDFVQPFVESNMLQLIFLAIICGIAAGLTGRYSNMIKELFEAFNDLFLKLVSMIIRIMPVAVFCSICSMMLEEGAGAIMSLLGIFATFVFGLACMMLAYSLLLLFVGRVNPVPFLKKYSSAMLQVFSLASSNVAIPVNMEACEKLGIASKIYSLSIPLGATVNMDGSCVYMAVFALALAKTYGVNVTGASITAIVISIVVLSIGAPGIPGSGLICLSVLLTQMGVPTEAIGLVMGIDSLIGMFRCMSNCTGDVAMSLLVANREKSLDMEKYMSDV